MNLRLKKVKPLWMFTVITLMDKAGVPGSKDSSVSGAWVAGRAASMRLQTGFKQQSVSPTPYANPEPRSFLYS
jgi:hypothetical protein